MNADVVLKKLTKHSCWHSIYTVGLTSSEDRSSITCSSKESQGAVPQGVDEGMVGDSGRKVFSTNSSADVGVL